MEANNRETENIDTIALLASDTASDRDTYTNLTGTVKLLMSELVIAKKNLVEAMKENNRLERVLGQCHQHASKAGCGGATGRGFTPNRKRGPLLLVMRI